MADDEPAPDSIARCGGCKKEYPRAVVPTLKYIGRGDLEKDGDRRLAYYNCPCNSGMSGTFCVAEPPSTLSDLALNGALVDDVTAAEGKMAPSTAEEHYIALRK